jgi:hypothetical protein
MIVNYGDSDQFFCKQIGAFIVNHLYGQFFA